MTATVTNAQSIASTYVMSDVPTLTPDAVLVYCETRLNALDSMVDEYFKGQQKNNKAMQDANKLVEIMNSAPCGLAKAADLQNNAAWAQGNADIGNALVGVYQSSSDPKVQAEAAKEFKIVTGHDISEYATNPPKQIDGPTISQTAKDHPDLFPGYDISSWGNQVQEVKDIGTGLSKQSELDMIQLQSLVSQRQLAVQLTTQLMQTMHDSAKTVVGNIR